MFKVIAAATLVLPFLAQSAFAADCARTYTVQQGDICDSISAAQNVSTYQLAVVNNGVINNACSNLSPGSSICLGYTGSDCKNTYVVKRGDSCAAIQSAAQINSTMLYVNNPQINEACDNIYIGEVLCVSGTAQVPPAPSGYVPPAAVIPTTALPANVPSATPPPPAPAAPTPAPSDSGDVTSQGFVEEDDDDLPYCDEL